jgi:YfiH family protein
LIEGDGLATGLDNTLIGILTADCVPLLLYDPEKRISGAAHAGWKGVYNGIAGNLVASMTRIGAYEPRLKAVIGPHIRKCCYEIGDDLAAKFAARFGEGCIVRKADAIVHLDLETALMTQLSAAGIAPENVFSPVFCTYCSKEPRFYSYRRGDISGRILTFVGLKS